MGLPTTRGVQGSNLKSPEKGLFEAAPGSLPLCETEVAGKASETLACGKRGGTGSPCNGLEGREASLRAMLLLVS